VRVAIVNDSPLAVEALRRVVTRGGHAVAWVAHDGVEAIAQCKTDRPDVLLMDLRMPVMGGVECTRRIMADAPCAILVVTATVSGHFEAVYDAMGAGALDAVNTPVLGPKGDFEGDNAFLEKLETIAKLVAARPPASRSRISQTMSVPTERRTAPPLIAIGASTGGPQALADVLAGMPNDLAAAIVIVQHVDAEFAKGLASWLKDKSGFPTEVALPGRTPQAGLALIAATNDHLVMDPDRRLGYTAHPRKYAYRPSVDVFFHSAAQHWPRASVGVVLTGMGRDGAAGLLALRQAGWATIAQDEETSVVYGMPKAAAEMDAASQVLPLPRIPRAILDAIAAPAARRGRTP
jgi:two-component system, chemotaxis family, response regulator WspF